MSKKHQQEFPDEQIEEASVGDVDRFAWTGLDEIAFDDDEEEGDE